jgi:predicted Zn-dependent protease
MNASRNPPSSNTRRTLPLRAWPLLVCLAGGLFRAAHAEENVPPANPVSLQIDGKANARARAREGAATVRAESAHEAQVRDWVHRADTAIRQKDFGRAETLLDALGRFLPERSLTRLRMRAWLDLSSGRDAAARDAYLEILERIENDENAGINLAILEARAGQGKEAARILADLARRHPDSAQLRATRQALGMDLGDLPAVFEE